jgi:hypothetical protein
MPPTTTTDPAIPSASVGLVRIRKRTHYLWEEEKNEAFISWWKTTEYRKGPDPHWGSKRRKTEIWSHFDECANITTGEPAICCRTCYLVFVHPSIRRNGNSAPSSHIRDSCTAAAGQKRGLQQSIADMVVKVW